MTKPNDDHEVRLTAEHWNELRDRYSELLVDRMDTSDLEGFAYEMLRQSFDELTPTEVLNKFQDSFDRETVDQVIRDITSEKSSRIGTVIGDDPCYS